jgi:aspartyl-tRNA(Asn)/glutamyl-tRNA(Gln) amidotransferase subunit C
MDIDIEYVAKLARIELDAKQKKKFAKQLSDILAYIEKLKELKVDKIEPMSHVLPLKNVFRQDKVKTSLPLDKVLKNAPLKEKGSFSVPKVIE